MANQKISDLTALTSGVSVDVLPIVDIGASTTKKITVSNLQKAMQIPHSLHHLP